MILSKTAEHAVRVLAFIARGEEKPYSAKFLADELDIPYKYLASLMTKLSKGGLLRPIKGRDGGFLISKPIDEIYLSDVLYILENYEHYDMCVLGCDQCDLSDPCMLHDPWSKLRSDINRFLKNTSISNLASMPTFKI